MNRRNLIQTLSFLIPTAIASSLLAFARAHSPLVRESVVKSPHADAIALVMEIHNSEIAVAEVKHFNEHGTDWFKGGSEQYWWHDTITRDWSVWRPIAPGVVDSTHWFIVSYRIDKTEIGRWSVDTRRRTAELLAKGAVM